MPTLQPIKFRFWQTGWFQVTLLTICAVVILFSSWLMAQLALHKKERLFSPGYPNKLIADKLDLSIDTVCSHLKHVFEKLHVNSRTEAVVRYMAFKRPQL
jgi:DNA-binding CsgD family transcriptional regulator